MNSTMIKVENKVVMGEEWKFSFRENGYVIVEKILTEESTDTFTPYLHSPNLESCLQYIHSNYNGTCGVLSYDELEKAS